MARGPRQVPRGAVRSNLHAEVGLRRPGLTGFRVRIFDASPEGCKIEFVDRPTVDERIWIRFDGLESLEGNVRWVKEHACGVHFSHPLHDAVFRKILANSKQAAPAPARPRRMRRLRSITRANAGDAADLYSVSEWSLEGRTLGPGELRPDDQACYVIEGRIRLRLNGKWSPLSRGSYAIIPGGTPHHFANEDTESAGFLTFTMPAGSGSEEEIVRRALERSGAGERLARPL